jgi:hypothetical protein
MNTVNPNIKNVRIWDLDGTVINSFHRVAPCFDSEGNLNLAKYMSTACTHEKIMADSVLPLVEYMKASFNDPETVNIICTARLMRKSDYYYLRKQGLRGRGKQHNLLMSRDVLHRFFSADKVKEIYSSRDADYKTAYFGVIKEMYPTATITMIDDNKSVLAAAVAAGLQTMDATAVNDILSIGVRLVGESFIDDSLDDDNDYQFLCERLEMCWQGMTDEERAEYTATPQRFIQKLKVA